MAHGASFATSVVEAPFGFTSGAGLSLTLPDVHVPSAYPQTYACFRRWEVERGRKIAVLKTVHVQAGTRYSPPLTHSSLCLGVFLTWASLLSGFGQTPV